MTDDRIRTIAEIPRAARRAIHIRVTSDAGLRSIDLREFVLTGPARWSPTRGFEIPQQLLDPLIDALVAARTHIVGAGPPGAAPDIPEELARSLRAIGRDFADGGAYGADAALRGEHAHTDEQRRALLFDAAASIVQQMHLEMVAARYLVAMAELAYARRQIALAEAQLQPGGTA